MSVPATAVESNAPGPEGQAPSTGPGAGAAPAGEERAGPTQVSSPGGQEQVTRSPDYVRDAFARMRGYTQVAAPAPQPQANGNAQAPAAQAPPASSPVPESERPGAPPATTFPAAPSPMPSQGRGVQQATPATGARQGDDGPITLTRAELQRQIQSEADRILAKQKRDDEARASQEQERELRRSNPFEYARLMEQKEQELEASRAETGRLTDIVSKQLIFYDRAVLDTFVGALPEDERARVIAPDGDGIENRKKTAANTLRALRSRWTAEGRASAKADLMKDQTFIKEVLARYGQAVPEPQAAPVAIRSASDAAPSNGNEGMNNWMRTAGREARAVTR